MFLFLLTYLLSAGLFLSLLRPARSLLRPFGSSVVLELGTGASVSLSSSSSSSDASGASVDGSGVDPILRRPKSGFTRRTCTGALAAGFGRAAATFTRPLLRNLFNGLLFAAGAASASCKVCLLLGGK